MAGARIQLLIKNKNIVLLRRPLGGKQQLIRHHKNQQTNNPYYISVCPLSVRNYGVEPSTGGLGIGIILGSLFFLLVILHHVTILHDEPLVPVWIID